MNIFTKLQPAVSVHDVGDPPGLARERGVVLDQLEDLVVGHVRVGLLDRVLDQRLLQTEVVALVDDVDALLIEGQHCHTPG